MSREVLQWSELYESTKRKINNKRVFGQVFTPQENQALLASITQLTSLLNIISSSPFQHEVSASEVARRKVLLENLKKQFSSAPSATKPMAVETSINESSSSRSSYNPLSTSEIGLVQRQKDVVQLQDQMINEIGVGVDRLHQQALHIGDEARIHINLLENIDSDVDSATAALQAETKHAERIRESSRMCKLYICVVIEVLIIVLLLILWGAKG